MAKIKTTFFCQNCGQESPKWLGKCPACNEWNTFVEEIVSKGKKNVVAFSKNENRTSKSINIKDIQQKVEDRIILNDPEMKMVCSEQESEAKD